MDLECRRPTFCRRRADRRYLARPRAPLGYGRQTISTDEKLRKSWTKKLIQKRNRGRVAAVVTELRSFPSASRSCTRCCASKRTTRAQSTTHAISQIPQAGPVLRLWGDRGRLQDGHRVTSQAVRDVLAQRHHRLTLHSAQQQVRGLLGIPLIGRMNPSTSMSHTDRKSTRLNSSHLGI